MHFSLTAFGRFFCSALCSGSLERDSELSSEFFGRVGREAKVCTDVLLASLPDVSVFRVVSVAVGPLMVAAGRVGVAGRVWTVQEIPDRVPPTSGTDLLVAVLHEGNEAQAEDTPCEPSKLDGFFRP